MQWVACTDSRYTRGATPAAIDDLHKHKGTPYPHDWLELIEPGMLTEYVARSMSIGGPRWSNCHLDIYQSPVFDPAAAIDAGQCSAVGTASADARRAAFKSWTGSTPGRTVAGRTVSIGRAREASPDESKHPQDREHGAAQSLHRHDHGPSNVSLLVSRVRVGDCVRRADTNGTRCDDAWFSRVGFDAWCDPFAV